MLLGIAEMAGTITCVILVHFTGKRPLVFMSAIGCGLCFLGTATYAYFLNSVPGSAVSNIVANASTTLNHDSYLSDIPINFTDFRLDSSGSSDSSSSGGGSSGSDEPKNFTSIESGSNEGGEFMSFDYGVTMKDAGLTEDMSYESLFDNLEISILSVNESYPMENDYSNVTLHRLSDRISVLPKSIFVPIPKAKENKLVWIPMTLLLGSAYLSHSGIRLIPWLLIGELYPPSVRSGAAGISGGTGYMFGFLSNKLFLTMIGTLTLPGTFWFYSSVSLLGALILYFILPETEGRTLMDIEKNFKKKRPKTVEDAIIGVGGVDIPLENRRNSKLSNLPPALKDISKIVTKAPPKPQKKFSVHDWESNKIFKRHLEAQAAVAASHASNNQRPSRNMGVISGGSDMEVIPELPLDNQMGRKKNKFVNNRNQNTKNGGGGDAGDMGGAITSSGGVGGVERKIRNRERVDQDSDDIEEDVIDTSL